MASTGIAPPRLREGDTVAVCAPASPVRADRLRRGVQVLGQRYRMRVSEGVLSARGYLAGDDELRADELNRFLRDPDVRAVIPANGGYGITRILDRLDATALHRDPKIIVGFSEGTALLSWALAAAGLRSIHGPMVASFGELPKSQQQHMLELLEGRALPGPFHCRKGHHATTGLRGQRQGPLLGGNLTLLSVLIGTSYQLDFDDAVMFFEDIGKDAAVIDRLLTHLHTAGMLAGVKAALLGELFDCGQHPGPSGPTAEEVVLERMETFGIPLLVELPIGHGAENLAIPFGAQVNVDLDNLQLTFLEGAVA